MIPRVMYRRTTTKKKQQVCTVVKRYRPLDETFMSVLKRDQTKNTLLKELCHLKMKWRVIKFKCTVKVQFWGQNRPKLGPSKEKKNERYTNEIYGQKCMWRNLFSFYGFLEHQFFLISFKVFSMNIVFWFLNLC